MPTIIDSLLIELGIDTKGMSKGQKEGVDSLRKIEDQHERTRKVSEDNSKKMADSFLKVRNQVLSLLTVFTAGKSLKGFVEGLTAADSSTGRLARNINTATEELAAWQGVAERTGGSAEGIAASLQGLTQEFQTLALTGNSGVVPFFRAVGVQLANSEGKLRPLRDILLDLSDKFSKMDPAKAQALGRGMGLDEGTVNVLIQGREALVALLAEQERLGRMNERDAKAAQERQKALRGLAQSFENVGRVLLTMATPAIVKFSSWLTKISEWLQTHPQVAAAAFGTMGVAVASLTAALGGKGMMTAISLVSSLAGKLARVAGVLGLLAGSAAAGWGIGSWINKNFVEGTPFGDWLGETIAKGVEMITGVDPVTGEKRNGPRGVRNNNSGNLKYARQAGASREANGPFAVFQTMQDGLQALVRQLQLYASRGIDTIQGLVEKYAPGVENDVKAYVDFLAKRLGVSADSNLDLANPETLRALVDGITTMENGSGFIRQEDIDAAVRARSATGSKVETSMHIDRVDVHTQATDANGIARDFNGALAREYGLSAMADYGLA